MAIKSINYDICVGCGNCVKSCAPDALRMNPETKKPIIKYPEACVQCNLCVRYCPVGALYIDRYKDGAIAISC